MTYINIVGLWMELLLRSAWKLKDKTKSKTKQRDSDDEEEIKKTDQESDSG